MDLKYEEINSAILNGNDVPNSVIKDKDFYNYLLNNRVANYYCRNLSKKTNSIETDIIKAGEKRNNIFYKTLLELEKICSDNNIKYLLYKTHKYFDEVIGGDIDIIVKEEDFDRFLEVFTSEGWLCEEDEKRKGKCEKDGFIVIEPHVNISWNGLTFIPQADMWENHEKISINNITYNKTSIESEKLSIYFKIIFGPEYLDLYDNKILNLKSKDNNNIHINGIDYLKKKIIFTNKNLDKKFPIFLNSFEILWFNTLFSWKYKKINKMMFIHNLYWINRYKINGKLPFLTKYMEIGK